MSESRPCCDEPEAATPRPIANAPGLPALAYRVGTHGSFLATMMARLSGGGDPNLGGLTTRDRDDPAIALLDAWATVADLLTFYQERIANEGYLRTALERRSLVELARLVGYEPRPGVAATGYLAYTLDAGYETTIPAGSRAQSVPRPGEAMQTFETAEDLEARAAWNDLQPRRTRPAYLTLDRLIKAESLDIFIEGLTTLLRAGEPLLFVFDEDPGSKKRPFVLSRVAAVEPQALLNRTRVSLPDFGTPKKPTASNLDALVETLAKNGTAATKPTLVPFTPHADAVPRLLLALNPGLRSRLYAAWAKAPATSAGPLERAQVLRVKAAPFGHNAPLQVKTDDKGKVIAIEEWPIAVDNDLTIQLRIPTEGPGDRNQLDLILRGSGRPDVIQQLKIASAPGKVGDLDFELRVEGNWPAVSQFALKFDYRNGELKGELELTKENDNKTLTIKTKSTDASTERDIAKRIPSGDVVNYDLKGHWVRAQLRVAPEVFTGVIAYIVRRKVLPLDAVYDQIKPGGWIIVERPYAKELEAPDRPVHLRPNEPNGRMWLARRVEKVRNVSRSEYGLTGRVTELTLDRDWLASSDLLLTTIRETTVYAQGEDLRLAEELVAEPVKGSEIELGALYDGLKPGRWLIVAGERTDLPGVKEAELVRLAAVTQDVGQVSADRGERLPGDKSHTFLHLAPSLRFEYKRDTVTVHGNVVRSTHGETRREVLGSGDASRPLQAFSLKQGPLTFVPAATPRGVISTLEVRVNGLRWHERESLAGAGPTERCFVQRTDDQDRPTVMTGDGEHGARLPTGAENVHAIYRVGLGRAGNLQAEQISLAADRPLGVRSVINPRPADGGADRDGPDDIRRHAPLAHLALGRLLSTRDYADFARTFAGIGKAAASRLSDGQRQVVHVTVAGAADVPIAEESDLFANLLRALRRFGDPNQPVRLALRERLVLVLVARVQVETDHAWETVEPRVRQSLLQAFSFDRRELGQDVVLGEVLAVMHRVPGVAYVDVDAFAGIPEKRWSNAKRVPLAPSEVALALQWVLERGSIAATAAGLETLATIGGGQALAGALRALFGTLPDPVAPRIPVHLAHREPQGIVPAQIAYFAADVPDTLRLTEVRP